MHYWIEHKQIHFVYDIVYKNDKRTKSQLENDLRYIYELSGELGDRVMVFNSTLNNISVISWRSALLVEDNGISGENHPTCRKSMVNFIT
jgi:hypothetical protein